MNIPYFAWNAETIGFWGTIALTIVRLWGLWRQNKAIWVNRSGKSISVPLFSYSLFAFAIVTIYGLSIKNFAFVFNGVLHTIIYAPILIGLWKFKGFTKLEKILIISFLGTTLLAAILPHKDVFFFGSSVGNVVVSFLLPMEIYRNKNRGVVSIQFLWVSLINSSFWTLYGFAIKDWVLEITCPIFLAIAIVTILLWFKYKNPKTQ
jgi:uncharacterized protein with PQ loop repeat